MTLNTFGLAIAQQLVESDNKFPVDFDLAWEWLGFSNKANAKKALLKAGFIEGVDLILKDEQRQIINPSHFGSGEQTVNYENISLTVECFKMWAMMSGTSKGKEVRLYFLECEKIAKAKVTPVVQQQQPKLTYGEQSLKLSQEIRSITDNLDDNPRLAQLLIDHALKDIVEVTAIAGTELHSLVSLATELGYKTDMSSRTKLGQFVARQLPGIATKEKRICNGEMRSINCYPKSSEVLKAINQFFS